MQNHAWCASDHRNGRNQRPTAKAATSSYCALVTCQSACKTWRVARRLRPSCCYHMPLGRKESSASTVVANASPAWAACASHCLLALALGSASLHHTGSSGWRCLSVAALLLLAALLLAQHLGVLALQELGHERAHTCSQQNCMHMVGSETTTDSKFNQWRGAQDMRTAPAMPRHLCCRLHLL